MDHHIWTTEHLARVELALSNWVIAPSQGMASAGLTQLCEAMRYAVLDGGKRLRPLLVFAAAEAAGGWRTESGSPSLGAEPNEAALRAACAVELIHAYSLVHDDMPCMDNDVLRRGKPTVHVKFGEAQALLAGDALQALAFELLTPSGERVDPAVQATLCRLLATSAGCQGMAGGQAIDLASVGQRLTLGELQNMHKLKTGALLQTSVMMGAACGRISPQAQVALAEYGAVLGLAFQVVDDILDVTADTATLGKTAGKDAQDNKPTFVSLLGLDASRAYAQTLLGQALQALKESGLADTRALSALADVVVNRKM
ncbi:MAG: polyprenyl synthetase family protein [Burkholderiaceae bacterium]